MVAQRFPEDFDGILAGDPGNDWSHWGNLSTTGSTYYSMPRDACFSFCSKLARKSERRAIEELRS